MTAPVPEPPAGLLETAELTRRLRQTEAELARVTLRLRRLESSGTVQLAQLVAAAVRSPRQGLVDLPRGAAAIMRRSRARRGPHARRTGASSSTVNSHDDRTPKPRARGPATVDQPADPGSGGGLGDRLLAASALLVTTRDRPVVAAIADPASAQAWAEGAYVQGLRPDDAVAVFAAVTPDVLVVHPAAGRSGPWSGVGTYAVPDRDRTVLELLRAARERGVPAVVVAPATPAEAPMLVDARPLFAGEVGPDAAIDEILAAAPVPA
jgi:hypothetical protein